MKLLKFTREAGFLGRNGYFRAAGLEIMALPGRDLINISPLTSRLAVGRCEIEIPVEDIEEVINTLRQVSAENQAALNSRTQEKLHKCLA